MIAHLKGKAAKLSPGELLLDVQGVGYRVLVPIDVWDTVKDGMEQALWISTYVREDRLDLFGFLERSMRTLFEKLIDMPGIGPRTALEICAVPGRLLAQAVQQQDPRMLMGIKGIGKKTAEKLLVDLRALSERHPDIVAAHGGTQESVHDIDQDAIAALSSLGYDMPTIMNALKNLPDDLQSTEERVAAALRTF